MSDATRRALRTLFQFVVAGGLTALINGAVDGLDPSWLALVQAVNQLIVTFAQNWLEDNTAVPALLKAPASEGENPVPDDAGQSLVVVIVGTAVGLLLAYAILRELGWA